MLKHCRYCGTVFDGDEGVYFCSKECEKTFDTIARRDAGNARFLLGLVVIAVIFMVCGALFFGRVVTGCGCMLMGFAIILCPFATPNMISIIGYRRARIAIRIVGVLAIAFGGWIMFFAA